MSPGWHAIRLFPALLLLACTSAAPRKPAGFKPTEPAPAPSPTPPPPAAAAPPAALRVPADSAAGTSFELRVDPCPTADDPKRGCPFIVALMRGASELSRTQVDFAAAVGPASLGPVETSMGAGDPLSVDKYEVTAQALHTGHEASSVSSVARPLALAPGVAGLLVDQVAGQDHEKRAHFVFVAVGDALRPDAGFRFAEGSGPTWSSMAEVDLGEGRSGALLIAGSSLTEAYDDRPDTVDIQLLEWDGQAQKVASRAGGGGHATAVAAAPQPSVAKAKQLREQHPDCLRDYWILPQSKLVARGAKKGFALAALGVSRAGADSKRDQLEACWPEARAQVLVLP